MGHGIDALTSAGASIFVDGSGNRDAGSDSQNRGRRNVRFAPRTSRVTLHRDARAAQAGSGTPATESTAADAITAPSSTSNIRAGPGSTRTGNSNASASTTSTPQGSTAVARGALVS